MNNKPASDTTPVDFIQHTANLRFYERKLTGYIKLGMLENNPIRVATNAIVIALRVQTNEYIQWHKIDAVL